MDDVIARASDEALWVALQSSLPRVQRIALALTNDHDDADELVADAISRMLPRWRIGAIDDPAAYFKRTVVNLATRRWRRIALGRSRDHRAVEWTQAGGDLANKLAERDATLSAIRSLPARRRTIVVLRYYDDLSLEQIADLLEINIGTVKSQLSRALEQLRVALEGQNEQ